METAVDDTEKQDKKMSNNKCRSFFKRKLREISFG